MKNLKRIGWEDSDWADLKEARTYLTSLNHNENDKELHTLRNMMIAELETQEQFDAWWDQEMIDEAHAKEKWNWEPINTDRETANEMLWMLIVLRHARFWKHDGTITELALAQSLCPLHFVDYAICFDDEDPLCAIIRFIWPNHDT